MVTDIKVICTDPKHKLYSCFYVKNGSIKTAASNVSKKKAKKEADWLVHDYWMGMNFRETLQDLWNLNMDISKVSRDALNLFNEDDIYREGDLEMIGKIKKRADKGTKQLKEWFEEKVINNE